MKKTAKKAKKAGAGAAKVMMARAERRRPLAMRKLAQKLDATLVEMAAKSEQGWETECHFETPEVDRLKGRKRH